MKHIYFTLIFIILSLSCNVQNQKDSKKLESKNLSAHQPITENSPIAKEIPIPSETPEEVLKYFGVAIDEKFRVLESPNSVIEKRIKGEKYFVESDGFTVEFDKHAPKRIKNNKSVLNIKTRETEYALIQVGIANLLTNNSKQVFLLGGTGGGVCCSVFWIFDTSNEKLRNIFRSEDYEHYRETVEVFDAEDDGIYEIVLFDSSFRYMLGDCGSCSPQPRVVFKYDEGGKKYLPAKGIKQDFIDFDKSEKWIKDTYEKLQNDEDFTQSINYHRTVRAFVVDLIYFGDEKKAWEIFDKYYPKNYAKEENRAEIKKILRQSKFYQALRRIN